MTDKLTVYLLTCDKTMYILPATIYLYKKYVTIPLNIKILGFTKPNLPDWTNVEFISLSNEVQNVNMWSTYIYNYLSTIDEKLIFVALDDFFPIDNFNHKSYKAVYELMIKNKIGSCIVSQQPSSDPVRNEVDKVLVESEDIFIYKRKRNIPYLLTLQPTLWNRNYFLKYLSDPCSPWEFEIKQTKLAIKDTEYYNISSSQFPNYKVSCILPFCIHSALSSRWKGCNVSGTSKDTVNELIHNNLVDKQTLILRIHDKLIYKYNNYKVLQSLSKIKTKKNITEWVQLYGEKYNVA